MNSQENSSTAPKDLSLKIYKKQKVKLYDIKHFIFDFGGVMVEKTFVLKNLFEMIENDFNISLPDKHHPSINKMRRRTSSGRISSKEFLEYIFETFYYSQKEKAGTLPIKKPNTEYYLELWFNLYSQSTELSVVMEEIIERLHRAGYTVSLMSNTFDVHAKSNELNGFYDLFDHVFLSNEIGYLKPDLQKYKYVLDKLNTKPKKCIFIDDKIQNLEPARKLGMTVIKFESIQQFNKILDDLGIAGISKKIRKKIKAKYEVYKEKKKEYKRAKKAYKKAKKEFLQKKSRALKRKLAYQKRLREYEEKKKEYKLEKKKKKDELISKIKIE